MTHTINHRPLGEIISTKTSRLLRLESQTPEQREARKAQQRKVNKENYHRKKAEQQNAPAEWCACVMLALHSKWGAA